jgi:hypothetical protein
VVYIVSEKRVISVFFASIVTKFLMVAARTEFGQTVEFSVRLKEAGGLAA